MASKVVVGSRVDFAPGTRISFIKLADDSPNSKVVEDPTSPFIFESATLIHLDQEDLLRIDYTVDNS